MLASEYVGGFTHFPSARLYPPSLLMLERWTSWNTGSISIPQSTLPGPEAVPAELTAKGIHIHEAREPLDCARPRSFRRTYREWH